MSRELAARVSGNAFEERYARESDPWEFATSDYERRRYDCVLGALSKPHYDVVYEPGCSIGVLTARLAEIASRVMATDIAPSAILRAKVRCKDLPNVELQCASVATFVPREPLDLVIFSEIGYYFERTELARIAAQLAGQLQPRGEFLAVHWLGHSEDHVLHGDEVHSQLHESLPLHWLKGEVHAQFRIDSWIKT